MDTCECPGWGEVWDTNEDGCACPGEQFWDSDWEYCECPTGEYWDSWYDQCDWDIWGFYTDAVCEEADHYEDDEGVCVEWTCEALGEKIDELLEEVNAIAPAWNEALAPILLADEELALW